MAGEGPREYVGDLSMPEILAKVRAVWGSTVAGEGACGSWSWTVMLDDQEYIVAEAWLHPSKPGWWLRIGKEPKLGYR
jgi:hypothetical protein